LPADDLLIKQAIALSSLSENEVSIEETASSSTDKTSGMKLISISLLPLISLFYHISDDIVGALISTGKRLSIALSSAASSTTAELEEGFSSTTPVEPTPSKQVDSAQKSPAVPSIGKCI
jgi:hypothetical protein